MFEDVRSIVKHSSIYSLGNFISKVLNVLLVPIYTKFIPVEMFGVYAIFQVTMQFCIGIFHFGLPNALIRWLSLEEEKIERGYILFSTVITTFLISISIVLIALFSRHYLNKLFINNKSYLSIILLVSLIIAFAILNKIGLAYLKFKERSLLFITISISKFFFQLIITIYFVAYLNSGIIGIFYGTFSGELISFLFLTPYLVKQSNFTFKYKETKNMIKYGFPLAFSGISNTILNIGDRYILGFLTNSSIVGVYSLGYKFANLIKTVFISSFKRAFIPSAWKKLKNKNVRDFYSKSLTYYVYFIFWIALLISVYSKGIIHLFARDNSYWDASLIVPIATFAIAIKGMYTIIRIGIQVTNRTKFIALIGVSAAILNIVLNLIAIPILGMLGAAIATFISFLFMVIVGYYFSNRFYPIQFEWSRLIKIGIVTFAVYFASYLLNPLPTLWRIFTKFVLLASYPFLLYLIDFYEQRELNRINGAWKKWTDWKNLKSHIKDINFK